MSRDDSSECVTGALAQDPSQLFLMPVGPPIQNFSSHVCHLSQPAGEMIIFARDESQPEG